MMMRMRNSPGWAMFEAVAPTLEYNGAEIGEDRSVVAARAAKVMVPTLIMDGGENLTAMPFMRATALALAKAIPHARQRTLEGQTHAVQAQVLAPLLVEFFTQPPGVQV